MSESVTPSPTSTPHPPGDDHKGANPVVWAVTDLSNVPKGSIIINPEVSDLSCVIYCFVGCLRERICLWADL